MPKTSVYDDDVPLIRYPLKITGSLLDCPPELFDEYAELDEAMLKEKYPKGMVESRVPIFHPGRVLVSVEAMVRVGRMNILAYLNYHVRSTWHDADFDDYLVVESRHEFTKSLCLCLRTNVPRTCTVIRMSHERLAERRRMEAQGYTVMLRRKFQPSEDDKIPF